MNKETKIKKALLRKGYDEKDAARIAEATAARRRRRQAEEVATMITGAKK